MANLHQSTYFLFKYLKEITPLANFDLSKNKGSRLNDIQG